MSKTLSLLSLEKFHLTFLHVNAATDQNVMLYLLFIYFHFKIKGKMRFSGLVEDLAVVIESVLQSNLLEREKNVLKEMFANIYMTGGCV